MENKSEKLIVKEVPQNLGLSKIENKSGTKDMFIKSPQSQKDVEKTDISSLNDKLIGTEKEENEIQSNMELDIRENNFMNRNFYLIVLIIVVVSIIILVIQKSRDKY